MICHHVDIYASIGIIYEFVKKDRLKISKCIDIYFIMKSFQIRLYFYISDRILRSSNKIQLILMNLSKIFPNM